MKIPSKLQINGASWDVYHLPDHPEDVGEYGECDYNRRIIKVYSSGDKTTDLQTFFHELFHALSYYYNLKLDQDEEQHTNMDVMSNVLVDTLIRNRLIKP